MLLPLLVIHGQAHHLGGKAWPISSLGDQVTGYAIFDTVSLTPATDPQHRQPGGHRFDHGQRVNFGYRSGDKASAIAM